MIRGFPKSVRWPGMHISLPKTDHVAVRVFDMQGKMVKQMLEKRLTHGSYEMSWDGMAKAGHRLSRVSIHRIGEHGYTAFQGNQLVAINECAKY